MAMKAPDWSKSQILQPSWHLCFKRSISETKMLSFRINFMNLSKFFNTLIFGLSKSSCKCDTLVFKNLDDLKLVSENCLKIKVDK